MSSTFGRTIDIRGIVHWAVHFRTDIHQTDERPDEICPRKPDLKNDKQFYKKIAVDFCPK